MNMQDSVFVLNAWTPRGGQQNQMLTFLYWCCQIYEENIQVV